jgi:hypothetical protein
MTLTREQMVLVRHALAAAMEDAGEALAVYWQYDKLRREIDERLARMPGDSP